MRMVPSIRVYGRDHTRVWWASVNEIDGLFFWLG